MSSNNKISSLKEKKDLKDKGVDRKNDWSGFASSLFQNIVNIILLVIIGSNLLYSIKYLGTEKFLPTDVNNKPYNVQDVSSPFKSFPYKKVINPQKTIENLQNFFATNIQDNWIFSRNIVQEIFNNIKDIYNPSILGLISQNSTEKYKSVIDYIIFLASPFISILLMIFVSIGGFFASMYNGFKQSDNILYKFAGVIAGYNIGIFTSLLQSIWFLGFLIIKPLIINPSSIWNTIKRFRKLILFLFGLSIISSSSANLDKGFNLGIIIGFIILFAYPLLSHFLSFLTYKYLS